MAQHSSFLRASLAFAAISGIAALVFVATQSNAALVSAPRAHPELGRVTFKSDFERAKADAKRSGKPIFVLFDEVPGCSTVQGYGASVLSHPLIVDAIETAFVPAFVKNNAGPNTAHTKVLKAYGEPAWNNPVGRVVDASGAPLLPRLNGDYSVGATAKYLVDGLQKAGTPVPDYLALLANVETAALNGTLEEAQFSMYCFWSGEVGLGEIEGVVSTSPAHSSAGEIVSVQFDRSQVSYASLVTQAKAKRAATTVLPLTVSQRRDAEATQMSIARPAPLRDAAKDDKYQLHQSPLRFVPMTDAQRTKVNAAVGRGQSPNRWLSPRQLRVLKAIEGNRQAASRLSEHPPLSLLWDVEATLQAGATDR